MVKEFTPGSFGFHELVDRLALVGYIFEHDVVGHPSIKGMKREANQIVERIWKLYNKAAIMEEENEIL